MFTAADRLESGKAENRQRWYLELLPNGASLNMKHMCCAVPSPSTTATSSRRIAVTTETGLGKGILMQSRIHLRGNPERRAGKRSRSDEEHKSCGRRTLHTERAQKNHGKRARVRRNEGSDMTNSYLEELRKEQQKNQRDLELLLKEVERDRKRTESDKKRAESDRKAARRLEAQSLTEKAIDASSECYRLLYSGLREPIVVDWESLKKREPFPKEAPTPPRTIPIAPAPDRKCLSYSVVLSVWDRLSPKRRDARTAAAACRFEEDTRKWRENKASIEAQNAQTAQDYAAASAQWNGERARFVGEQDEHNQSVDAQKEAYFALNREPVVQYCDLVLSRSSYPE
jgi:hypothetical protein